MADNAYTDEETARRRDEALKRALSMPPKHHGKDEPKKKAVSKGDRPAKSRT